MKAKLLKKLRDKFIIEYFPSTKMYKVNSADHPRYMKSESAAKAQQECDILNYGRKYYEKYSKHIRI